MEKISKRLYMREHSNVIRKFQSLKLLDKMEENPIFNVEGTNRLIIVTICRIRQRMLTQAWRILVRNTGVSHDYETDARVILSRKLPDEELRTELEIEVLFKWIYATKDIDPTGIANTIYLCKKRSAVYNALQQLRLEFYEPGETVLFQGDIPRVEDGHFTIFEGVCEVLQFPEDSMPLMKLLYLAKKKKWDDAKKLLNQAIVLARISKASGFGELSTLTGVKRAATIRIDPNSVGPAEIIVLPKQALLDCLKSRRQDGVEGAAPSEAMDFMRQSGLANRISPKDLVQVAQSMVRRTLLQGEILFYKGETVKSLFLVVSGELLLDTGDFMVEGKPQAFVNSNPDNCYHMSSGSILGDEGVTGQSNRFESTAAVVSDAAVVFEAVGFGLTFLSEKIGALRYCALTYRDKTRWSAPILMAEEINPYTYFHSLRKAIAYTHPYRGSRPKIYADSANDHDASTEKKIPKTELLRRRSTKSLLGSKYKTAGQSNVKKLAPLARMDSNLAYMLNTEHDTNPKPVVEFDYPRKLKPVGLHHAVDINRTAKKLAQKFVKVHAQENILYDQMTKNLMAAAPGVEQQEAEAKFKSYILEYKQRAAAHALQVQQEMERERLQKAYSASTAAVKFYGTLSPDSSIDGSAENSNKNKIQQQRRRAFSKEATEREIEIDMEDVIQSTPFATPFRTPHQAQNESRDDFPSNKTDKTDFNEEALVDNSTGETKDSNAQQADGATILHSQSGKEKEKERQLNVSVIEKELTDALMLHDVEHLPTLTNTATEEVATYEDEIYYHRPKIVQYFIWMDHLNRHTYRALLQQSQQTIDHNAVRTSEKMKLAITDRTMEELTNIFNRFGLTPTDMNIPWRPGSPKSGLAHIDESDEEDSTVPVVLPSTPSVPILDLPKVSRPSTAEREKEKDHKGKTKEKYIDATLWGRADKDKERHHDEIKVQGKFKTYNPSSWRHELIMKKEKAIVKENLHLFQRGLTPDNRRVCSKYFHYPGQHLPDYCPDKDPRSRPNSRFNSRPGTANHFSRHPAHDRETETASFIANQEKLVELQNNFSDDPKTFMEAVMAVDFNKRKQHLPDKEWKTRFISNQSAPYPGASANAEKAERILNQQASRTILSDSYSKQVLLGKAREILNKNSEMYTLTDSNKILQASLEHGMLHTMQHMRSMRTFRSSFFAKSAGRQAMETILPDLLDLPDSSLQSISMDEASTASHSRKSSVGHLSLPGNENDTDPFMSGRRASGNGRDCGPGESARSHTSSVVIGIADGGSEIGDNDENNSIGSSIHDGHAKKFVSASSPSQLLASGGGRTDNLSPSSFHTSPGHTTEEGGRGGPDTGLQVDDQSVGGSILSAAFTRSRLSPVAPAPSHLEMSRLSEDGFNVQLNSALEAAVHSVTSAESTHNNFDRAGENVNGDNGVLLLPAPLERGDTQTSFDGPVSASASAKVVDAAALRVKQLRERIEAQAPSEALEAFNTYMRNDNNGRKFYEGKKKAGANSKYRLISSLQGPLGDATKPTDTEKELFGIKKRTINPEIALFNSLFPNSTDEQRLDFIIQNRKKRAEAAATRAATGLGQLPSVSEVQEGSMGLTQHHLGLEGNSKMSVKDLKIEALTSAAALGSESRSRAESRTAYDLDKDAQHAEFSRLMKECEELDMDPDVVIWQHFTVDTMKKEKSGPKKILPVLIAKNEGGASSRRFAVNKSKRWGSGVLLELAAQADEEPIKGPPSYLEIFKGTQRRRLREKDRKRITDELHALIK